MKTLLRLGLIITLALAGTAASCQKDALPPNTSIEDKTAVRGTQFIEAVRAVNQKLPSLECAKDVKPTVDTPCIGAAEAADIYKAIANIGAGGKDLSGALTVIDNAKTAAERKKGLEAAAAIAKSLSEDIAKVQIRPLNPQIRATLVTLFASASNILLTLTLF